MRLHQRIAVCGLLLVLGAATPLGSTATDAKRVRAAAFAAVATRITHSAPATVVSLNESRFAAEISAPIVAIEVRVGDVVETGTELVRLDCRDYERRLAGAEARLAVFEAQRRLARQQLDRVKTMVRSQSVSEERVNVRQAELDAVVAEIRAQDAVIAEARNQVDRCTITCPFRAAILERIAQVGEMTMPGTPLLRVLDLDAVELSAQVPAEGADGVEGAVAVRFRYAGGDYPVKLRAITPIIDVATRSRETRLLFTGERPPVGAVGRLLWEAPGRAAPADALVRRGEHLGVLLVRDGKAAFQPIPGALEGRPAIVDLASETLIITEGRHGVEAGEAVEVVE